MGAFAFVELGMPKHQFSHEFLSSDAPCRIPQGTDDHSACPFLPDESVTPHSPGQTSQFWTHQWTVFPDALGEKMALPETDFVWGAQFELPQLPPLTRS